MNARSGEGRDILWRKTKLGFKYHKNSVLHAYKFIDEYDWFLKADDDTYVVMENLKLLVADYSPKRPLYFGHHFKRVAPKGYMSGGAGYLLSQAALRNFVDEGLNGDICEVDISGAEEADLGNCLNLNNEFYETPTHLTRPAKHMGFGGPIFIRTFASLIVEETNLKFWDPKGKVKPGSVEYSSYRFIARTVQMALAS
ncbi:hypothetical protein RvY_18051 [Ramazzottius varieornatus]|uniref:N-acetylgalactosaminide beta-1,3-galactosyltransferase n=1 Tax=Ramazzottius varieornatus TaxID=947166 RepID=A0A1D1W4G7_RAMVA|nr:hypothetical protein RvY_18051 [Ramazzottius varieornatus]